MLGSARSQVERAMFRLSSMLLAVALALAVTTTVAQAGEVPEIVAQDSGATVRLRGISAVDPLVAWASGREGTVLRTVDGGEHWADVSVPGADALDFRDVEGFDAQRAVVLGIGPGEASRVYRTDDGGKTWALALKNDDPRAFFDCMVFQGELGWMLGDPVDGRFQIRSTGDGGRTWSLWKDGPEALPDEAAFAASGTCIALGFRNQLLVVGGGAAARVHVFRPDTRIWTALDTRLPQRIPAAGIFSATDNGLVVGGDFEREQIGGAAWVGFGKDGPVIEPLASPRGYRSGAACRNSIDCIAVGPTGVDRFDGQRWSALSDTGYDAVDIEPTETVAWTSGDKGRIARITWPAPPPQPPAPLPPRPAR
jgi:photosystem II stability/assembly factor-like uncharacterized protein